MRRVAWLVVTGLALAGCRAPAPAANDPQGPAVPKAKPVPLLRYEGKLPAIAPQVQPVADAVAPFVWRAALTAADVPDRPVTGRVGGREFICRYCSVTPDAEDKQPTVWLRFSSQPRGEDCSFALRDDSVSLEWHKPSGVGAWSKKLNDPTPEAAAAWYAVCRADGSLLTGASHPWAVYLKIEEARGPTQAGGIASMTGRIALCFGDGEKKSWLAGRFVADGCRWKP
jgi:hypothetical protein